jgi:hypothetical protein
MDSVSIQSEKRRISKKRKKEKEEKRTRIAKEITF